MADSTITSLPAASTVAGTEPLPIDQSGATVKVTIAGLAPGLPAVVGDSGSGGTKGSVPAPGSGDAAAGKFLKADGTWAVPSGGGGGGTTVAATVGGRLTLTSGTAVTTTDVTGATTIYFTPYKGAQIGLYNGSSWDVISFSETSIALGTLTSGANYDVFAYNNSGTLALEFSAAWTSDTARNDALALQDGIRVKSSAHTRRLLGTFRTTATTTTEDSLAKRFLWNAHNQERRSMFVTDTTDSWTYTTATFRQARASAANQLDYVTGDASTSVEAIVRVVSDGSAGIKKIVGVGVNSTSVNSAQLFGENSSGTQAVSYNCLYRGNPGLGRNFLAWLEYSQASGTSTWYGDAGTSGPVLIQSGISGSLFN